MKTIYFDHAATTWVRPEVIEEMSRVLASDFGNPSSTHAFGRHAKNTLELARKTIAKCLNCSASEILFTSGGTEADNWILRHSVASGVERIITSKIEHHAILHTVDALQAEADIKVDYVKITREGSIDMTHLAELLAQPTKTLVTLMHVNNETGTQTDLFAVGKLCREHGALFHSDTVQSVGKTELDLSQIPVDFISASAHKFHGPKGVGFAFVRKGLAIRPMIFGGEQEKGSRAGTEAVHNIAGMAVALEVAQRNLEAERRQISEIRDYALRRLMEELPGTTVNGAGSFYNILNVCLPISAEKSSMLLFHLDMKGIAVSRGSACQSGSPKPSHVLAEFLSADDLAKPSLRLSFSHDNTQEEVEELISVLKSV
jgi:cysteine desulfurase